MTIKIKKNFLIFRKEAQNLAKLAEKELMRSRTVFFDFSNAVFLSRSFVDELLNILAHQKKIKIVNLSPHFKKFLNIVKSHKT